MARITYKDFGGRNGGNGINTHVRWFSVQILPQSTPQKTPQHHPEMEYRSKIEMLDLEGMPTTQPPPRSAIATQTELPSTASTAKMNASYETPKLGISSGDDESTDDDNDVRGFFEIAITYLNMRFLDEQYGIRRDGNKFMIANSDVIATEKGDITIRGKRFMGSKGLWELLTRKNLNRDVITNSDLKRYKHSGDD